MAYDCRVFRVLIASPSDVDEEREVAVRVIQEWNDLYSYSRRIVLLPLRWETHTAPEYGTRPQEVINKAIVDQCDLLVGIFWTRIGSPTGKADSGTLEEIERVGLAEKPIMLYFSKVGIDPDKIDLDQIEKLKHFKEKTYPKGLIENYKSLIEFRDKFSKQLELKVRDLQKNDSTGVAPLSLNFLSVDDDKLMGNKYSITVNSPIVVYDSVPEDKRESVKKIVAASSMLTQSIPIELAIDNTSSSGIRNLYVEIEITSNEDKSSLSESDGQENLWKLSGLHGVGKSSILNYYLTKNNLTKPKHARFESDKLIKTEKGWRLMFDWDAIQPQRTRLIKPTLYYTTNESSILSFNVKIFADSFPEPLILHSEMNVTIEKKETPLNKVLPNWSDILDKYLPSINSISAEMLENS